MTEEPLNSQKSKLLERRDFVIRIFLGFSFFGIALRLWKLQIKEGKKYKNLSLNNRIRLISVSGARGKIYDKNNIVLSKNIPSFDLVIVPEDCPDIRTTLKKVSSTLGIPYQVLKEELEQNIHKAAFLPIKLFNNLSWQQISLINAYYEEFPGISVDVNPVRFYPFGHQFAHILGYMTKAKEKQIQKLNKNQLKSATYIGSYGIEEFYNSNLLGKDGGVQVEVNSLGRVINTKDSKVPTSGNDIQLSIDSRLQKHISKIFEGRKGGSVVMNPHNGEILAMYSNPSFNPNNFSHSLSHEEWGKLLKRPGKPLNNRCIQGIYSPGSTFKMVVAIAALEEGLINENFTYSCNGHYKFGRKFYQCWKKSGHGKINLIEAIEQSCNTFFYSVGLELGIDKIYEYASRLGLKEITEIDLHNEKVGIIPNKKWKLRAKKKPWFSGETLSASIGQGYVTVSPLQLVNYVNVFANGGYLVQPKILKKILKDEKQIFINEENTTKEKEFLNFDKYYLGLIKEGMRRSVHNRKGTSHSAFSSTLPISGKTGTTQVISSQTRNEILEKTKQLDKRLENHAWFIGYAPSDNPQVSIVVLLENGIAGKHAAKVAKEILLPYFQNFIYQPNNV